MNEFQPPARYLLCRYDDMGSENRPLCAAVAMAALLLLGAAPARAGRPTHAQRKSLPGSSRSRSLRPPIGAGEIIEAEQRLSALGYRTGPITGRFDIASRQALIAFQKVEGRKPSGRLTVDELEALRNATPPTPRDSSPGHVEVDLARQVLFVVGDDGKVSHILPVSTGTGKPFESEGWERNAVTPTGRFTVGTKIEGWHESPLGLLYYPSFIVGGIAIHGSRSVPAYPASHGCIRVPMFAAKELSALLSAGTVVLVYGDPPHSNSVTALH